MSPRKPFTQRKAPLKVTTAIEDAVLTHLFEIEDLPPRNVNTEITYRVRGDGWTVEVVKVEHHPTTSPKEPA